MLAQQGINPFIEMAKLAKAQVEAQQRRDEAVKNMPPIPDERPSRFDDFERGG